LQCCKGEGGTEGFQEAQGLGTKACAIARIVRLGAVLPSDACGRVAIVPRSRNNS
jgi:hypothetical protein